MKYSSCFIQITITLYKVDTVYVHVYESRVLSIRKNVTFYLFTRRLLVTSSCAASTRLLRSSILYKKKKVLIYLTHKRIRVCAYLKHLKHFINLRKLIYIYRYMIEECDTYFLEFFENLFNP